MIVKYKVSDFAKDLNLSAKKVLDELAAMGSTGKKNSSNLEENELNYLLEKFSKDSSVTDLNEFLNSAKAPKEEPKPAEKKAEKKHETPDFPAEIAFDDFCKCKMQVARVLSCEKVEKSNKLLQFRLSFGKDGERTILSGIAKYYKPEDLVGKQVVAVVNLAPRKIACIVSQGMLLSAVDDEDNLRLMSVGEGVEDGAIIG